MSTEEITPELRKFIRARFNVSDADSDFNDQVHLFDYGYVDSFGAVDLTAFVEQRFSIKISEKDLVVYPMNTIDEISTFVSKRLQKHI